MIVSEQLNLGFGIGEKDEKIRNFLGSQTEREIKKRKIPVLVRESAPRTTPPL